MVDKTAIGFEDDTQAVEPLATGGKVNLVTLSKRADFLRAARSKTVRTEGLFLQARARSSCKSERIIRVGFTCSKKVGNSVTRNRAKRRLREVARLMLPKHGRAGFDYVLIGRRDATTTRAFELLKRDFCHAVSRVHENLS
ncbi:MAG: ribonuclease P protein component [Pseudomonadota bacterium]